MIRQRFVLDLFGGDLAQLPPALQPMLQAGYLETEFEEFLVPLNAYAAQADHMEFEEYEEHRGVTITKTRPGLKPPMQLVTDPAAASTGGGGLDNGITPTDPALEQYTLAPGTYEDGLNLDLIGTNFAIVNRFEHYAKINIRQAIQSRDVLARNTLLASYGVGRAAVTSTSVGLTTTPAAVNIDDIRGLNTSIVNGVVGPVGGGANALPATVYPAGGLAGSYPVMISAAGIDSTNVTDVLYVGSPFSSSVPAGCARCQGISGNITIATLSGSKTIVAGDIIVAGDAGFQFMPNGRLHWTKLVQGDNLSQDSILDGVAYLRDQGVEPLSDGTYLMFASNQSMRSLFSDANFMQAWRGLAQSAEYKQAKVVEYLGVTIWPTTNAPRISLAGGGYAHFPMIVGKGALIDAWYKGLEYWASNTYQRSYIALSNGLAQILTPPVDRTGRQFKMSWLTIRDIVAPTDVTATSLIIFTSGGSRYKRGVVLPHFRSV
jgi:hypothetical protein